MPRGEVNGWRRGKWPQPDREKRPPPGARDALAGRGRRAVKERAFSFLWISLWIICGVILSKNRRYPQKNRRQRHFFIAIPARKRNRTSGTRERRRHRTRNGPPAESQETAADGEGARTSGRNGPPGSGRPVPAARRSARIDGSSGGRRRFVACRSHPGPSTDLRGSAGGLDGGSAPSGAASSGSGPAGSFLGTSDGPVERQRPSGQTRSGAGPRGVPRSRLRFGGTTGLLREKRCSTRSRGRFLGVASGSPGDKALRGGAAGVARAACAPARAADAARGPAGTSSAPSAGRGLRRKAGLPGRGAPSSEGEPPDEAARTGPARPRVSGAQAPERRQECPARTRSVG